MGAKEKTLTGIINDKKPTSLGELQSAEIKQALAALHDQFAQYAVPLEALRKQLATELGDRSLADELRAMRDEE